MTSQTTIGAAFEYFFDERDENFFMCDFSANYDKDGYRFT